MNGTLELVQLEREKSLYAYFLPLVVAIFFHLGLGRTSKLYNMTCPWPRSDKKTIEGGTILHTTRPAATRLTPAEKLWPHGMGG